MSRWTLPPTAAVRTPTRTAPDVDGRRFDSCPRFSPLQSPPHTPVGSIERRGIRGSRESNRIRTLSRATPRAARFVSGVSRRRSDTADPPSDADTRDPVSTKDGVWGAPRTPPRVGRPARPPRSRPSHGSRPTAGGCRHRSIGGCGASDAVRTWSTSTVQRRSSPPRHRPARTPGRTPGRGRAVDRREPPVGRVRTTPPGSRGSGGQARRGV
jgi:hypothetical protein